jgi:hypothetical protein
VKEYIHLQEGGDKVLRQCLLVVLVKVSWRQSAALGSIDVNKVVMRSGI